MEIKGGWKLFWKGKLTLSGDRLRIQLEWGPPIIWRPRFNSYHFETTDFAIQAGFLWWILMLGRKRKLLTKLLSRGKMSP